MEGFNTLGFIGGGNMAEAMLRGIISNGLFSADALTVSDPSADRREIISKLGVGVTESNTSAAEQGDIIILAVKPQQMADVLKVLSGAVNPEKLLVTIAAGIQIEQIESALSGIPVIRVMPNTPMLVGLGASAFARGTLAEDRHVEAVSALLRTGGMAVEVEENMMDAVTALSGSGPAYFFAIVEHLLNAAGDAGLNRQIAEQLLFQTIAGAAEMLKSSGISAEKLREKVTSPGGTTEAALKVFQRNDLAGTLAEGFREAVLQSKRLREKG